MHPRTLYSILLGALAAATPVGRATPLNNEAGGSKIDNLKAPPDFTLVSTHFSNTGAPFQQPFDCATHEAYEALRVALHVDYLELRRLRPADPESGRKWIVQNVTGTKCATGAKMKCEADLSAITSETCLVGDCSGNPLPGPGYYLVYTKGDTVARISTIAELMSVAGKVDSPAVAWMVAAANGYNVLCDEDWFTTHPNGILLRAKFLISHCPIQTRTVSLLVRSDGTTEEIFSVLDPETAQCIGRRPHGLVVEKSGAIKNAGSIVGHHFAEIARLEAASVFAFRILRNELADHDAPESLLLETERAAQDEIRHARAMAKIAHRYGAKIQRPHIKYAVSRSLVEIALENAVEGCVRETYGALEGMFRAQMAEDLQIRAAMHEIAVDEMRHGALSWCVAEWLESKLTSAERTQVQNARAAEIEALTQRVQYVPKRELVAMAGVPSAAQASALVEALRTSLWEV